MMAPKWFDKNLQLSNEDNFDQLRDVLRTGARGLSGRPARRPARSAISRGITTPSLSPPTGARLRTRCWPATGRRWWTGRRSMRCCRCPGRFVFAAHARQSGRHRRRSGGRPRRASTSPPCWPACDPVPRSMPGTPSGWSTRSPRRTSAERVNDGLPETLEEVIATYGHRYLEAEGGGRGRGRPGAGSRRIAAVLDGLRQLDHVSLDGNEQYADAEGVGGTGRGHRRPGRRWRGCAIRSSSSSSR